MLSILGAIEDLFEDAIVSAYPDLTNPRVMVTTSTKPGFGDYQCNSAMTLAKVSSSVHLIFFFFSTVFSYCKWAQKISMTNFTQT